MSEVKVKRNRPRNDEVVQTKFTITRTTRTQIEDAAKASGLSLGLYLELLLKELKPSSGFPRLDTSEEAAIKPAA